MARHAEDVRRVHRAVVAQDHQREEPLGQRLAAGEAAREERCGSGVQHDEVRLLAQVEVADPVVEIERGGAAQRGEIERAPR